MADVLTSGPEPGVRRRRPRWLSWVAVALAGVVLAVLAVRADPAPRPVARPAPTGTPAPVPVAPAPIARLDGDPGAGPAGARVLVGGGTPGILDLAGGGFTPLREPLQLGGDAYAVLGRGRGFVAAAVFFPSDEYARAALLRDDGTRVSLGAVRQLLPMRDGTVLALSCVPGADRCRLWSQDSAGGFRWRRDEPADLSLVADTPYGLVTLLRQGFGAREVRVQDARTGRVLRVLGRTTQVLAVSDRQVAFQQLDCEPGCPVLVVRLDGGGTTAVPVPVGRLAAGAFAPDGRSLALGVAALGPADPYPAAERAGYAVLVDLAARRWTPVPGLRTATGPPLPVWTRSGDRLLLVATVGGTLRAASWRPGDPRLTVLANRVPGVAAPPAEAVLLP